MDLFLIDFCNVVLRNNGQKRKKMRDNLEKVKAIVMSKKWLNYSRFQVQIVIDNSRYDIAIKREPLWEGVEAVWTYKNRKTHIPYKADDYIIDTIMKNGEKFANVIVVTSDKKMQATIIVSLRGYKINIEFISAENFMANRF